MLEDWVRECGNVYRIRLGLNWSVVSADPDLNAEIMQRRPGDFRRHPKITEVLEELGVLGVFNAEGATWRQHRKPVAEALNLRKVRSFYPIISEKAKQLLAICEACAKTQEPVSIAPLLSRFTTDVTTRLAFGYELNTLGGQKDEVYRCLGEIFPMVNRRMTAPLPVWRWYKRLEDLNFEKSLNTLRFTVLKFIQEAEERLKKNPALREAPTNFLEALLAEKGGHGFNRADIYSSIFTILLAGEDTTANSLSWVIYYLAQHPEVVERVRTEVNGGVGEAAVPERSSQHKALVFTQAVAQEAIRLKPTSPQLIMQSLQDVSCGGLAMPKGTSIILQNRVAQGRAEYFSKPERFLPQRWVPGACPAGFHHQADMVRAFGGGTRYCPGAQLAIHEMVLVIATLCKHFDMQLVQAPEDVKETFSFTMHPSSYQIYLRSHSI